MTSAARWDLVDVSCTSGVAPGTLCQSKLKHEVRSMIRSILPVLRTSTLQSCGLPPCLSDLGRGARSCWVVIRRMHYYGKQARICFSNYRKSLDALIPKDAVGLPSPTYAGTDAAQLPASC